MQIFKSVRYLLFLQQKRSQTTDQAVKSDEIKKVLSEQVGSEFGEKYYGDLLFLVENDGSKGVPMKDVALWYYCRVKQVNRIGARRSALLIIDVQYDFLPPTGSLAVKDGQEVIPIINQLRKNHKWDVIALTQDWHPKGHFSFASTNKEKGAQLFTPFEYAPGKFQMMWPDHCVQGSDGAKFHHDLKREPTDIVVQKGTNLNIDSYSGFFDNDSKAKTDLADQLRRQGITHIYVAGLAYDYCVGFSALDGVKEGFKTYFIEDGARGVAPDTTADMKKRLQVEGVHLIQSSEVNLSN